MNGEVLKLAKKRKSKRESKLRIPVPETLSPEAHLEMLSNREAVVDGCKGVVEYDENTIKINTGELIIAFRGDELLIKSLGADIAVITGKIAEITFAS